MMAALLALAQANRVTSSRRIGALCRAGAAFRVIRGGGTADHRRPARRNGPGQPESTAPASPKARPPAGPRTPPRLPRRNAAEPDWPHSRLMPARGGGFIQAYNAHLVTRQDGLILAGDQRPRRHVVRHS